MIFLPTESSVYMIRRKYTLNPEFFLNDFVQTAPVIDLGAVLWTPNKFKAKEFYSEESVETFLYDHLRDRPCEIIMVK